MKWCVLLTSVVQSSTPGDSDSRLDLYRRSIGRWLKETSLPIFVVESSGYTFPEFKDTRLKVFSFDLPGPYSSSSQYEARSLITALEAFEADMETYTHVLKVTARYFLPEIESILQNVEPDLDVYLQNTHDREIHWNNSELLGFRKTMARSFFEPIFDLGLMERRVWEISETYCHTRLPPIPNTERVVRGGDGRCVDPL